MRNERMRRVRRIHFVGIGGAGMGGIAEVLANLGYSVTGSDLKESDMTRTLEAAGAKVVIGHAATNVDGADVVVVSSAVPASNPEILAAREHRIPLVQRAAMLAELMRFRYGIAVAGTHGKTTTTSLIAAVLADAGEDPTFVVGGLVHSLGGHARLGAGKYLVAEADESDASFLHLLPMLAVVTNVDADHLETYGGDIARLEQAYVDFVHNMPFYGLGVVCIDDPGIRRLLPRLSRPMLTYGFSDDADIQAVNVKNDGLGMRFAVSRPGEDATLAVRLNLAGRHNVLNALAAVAVAHELGLPDSAVLKALTGFSGTGRRFEIRGEVELDDGVVTLVDDYGHHPREIDATIQTAREVWPERRLVVAFQPHRYSRTRDLLDDFAAVLSTTDVLVLMEVYAAGETPIAGADSRSLARAIRGHGQVEPVYVSHVRDLDKALRKVVLPGDVVLTMGAGDIGRAAEHLPARLAMRVTKRAER